MDNWFDRLSKVLGKGMSRREAFRRIGGGLLGALGLGAGRAAAAKPTPAPVACEPDITKSPYYGGCQVVCGGYSTTPDRFLTDPETGLPVLDPDTGEPIPVSSPYTRCVDYCVDCADPYYCPEGETVDPQERYGLVCTDNEGNLTCCGKAEGAPVYRTCRTAASKQYAGCSDFDPAA